MEGVSVVDSVVCFTSVVLSLATPTGFGSVERLLLDDEDLASAMGGREGPDEPRLLPEGLRAAELEEPPTWQDIGSTLVMVPGT